MPELPEVETIVRELSAGDLIDHTIIKAHVYWPRSVSGMSVDEFTKKITGQIFKAVSRRGKFIVLTLNKSTLLIHLRMTGKISINRSKKPNSSHERLQLILVDGRVLHFEDQRKFGKWYLLDSPLTKFNELGPEPLSENFTLEIFQSRFKKSSVSIKAFLLNQKNIVGLGNIYVDEALWMAKIHPQQNANCLTLTQKKDLFHAIRHVLQEGINHSGTTLGSQKANYYSVSGKKGEHQSYLSVFRKDGLPCPRCQTTILKIVVSQRGTHLCPSCQILIE